MDSVRALLAGVTLDAGEAFICADLTGTHTVRTQAACLEFGVYGVEVQEAVTPRPCRRQHSVSCSGVTFGTDSWLCRGM